MGTEELVSDYAATRENWRRGRRFLLAFVIVVAGIVVQRAVGTMYPLMLAFPLAAVPVVPVMRGVPDSWIRRVSLDPQVEPLPASLAVMFLQPTPTHRWWLRGRSEIRGSLTFAADAIAWQPSKAAAVLFGIQPQVWKRPVTASGRRLWGDQVQIDISRSSTTATLWARRANGLVSLNA